MMVLLRRYLVLAALAFWQGGFSFYTSVVVTIGTEVLEGAVEQGMITRVVTKYINLTGGLALALFALDLVACRGEGMPRRRLRWLCWAGMVAAQLLLVWLHPRLDALIDPVALRIHNRDEFRIGHRWYLWTSAVQWAFCLVYALLTLWAWRDEDRSVAPSLPARIPEEVSV